MLEVFKTNVGLFMTKFFGLNYFLSFLINVRILYLLSLILVVVFSLSLHEFSHAYVANFFGDHTARRFGRLTPNPLKHLSLLGTVCILIFGFGWARPVPVEMSKFKNPKKNMALVALAGPCANFILAFSGFVLYKVVLIFSNVGYRYFIFSFLENFFIYVVVLNLGLFVFNLIPIPPLDGSRVVMCFLPENVYYAIIRNEIFGSIVIMFLLYNGSLRSFVSRIVLVLLKFIGLDSVY